MATKGRLIVRAEGHSDLAYDDWGQAQLRVTEYKANRVEAQLIDLDADSQNGGGGGPMFSPPKPLRGW